MAEKLYQANDLFNLCGSTKKVHIPLPGSDKFFSFEEKVIDGVIPLIFHSDGLWPDIPQSAWEKCDLQDYSNLTSNNLATWVEKTRRSFHEMNESYTKPILPFPFRAGEIWDLNNATGLAISGIFYKEYAKAEWISQRSPDAQELARILLNDEPPFYYEFEYLEINGIANQETKKSWLEITVSYICTQVKEHQCTTAKELFRKLEENANGESPFRKGEGINRGKLIVTSLNKSISLKTIQNNWKNIKEASFAYFDKT